jgi:hypothetical protein
MSAKGQQKDPEEVAAAGAGEAQTPPARRLRQRLADGVEDAFGPGTA